MAQKALVFKIWDFISLDSKYILTHVFLTLQFLLDYSTKSGITGGTIWDKNPNDQSGQMTPVMYRIEVGGVPYTEPVKKFAVSRDGVLAALVTSSN